MRAHRLPPVDTTGYVSCPIDTPISEFDEKSPLPCIIVTPSSPTEYHIAFHHKDSPLKHVSFAVQQQRQQQDKERQQNPRARRAFLNALGPFVDTPPPLAQVFAVDPPQRRFLLKRRVRTTLVLSIPIFIVACHLLATTLIRSVGLGPFFGGGFSRGGFSSAAAHIRAQRDPQSEPEFLSDPVPVPALQRDAEGTDQPAEPQSDPPPVPDLD